MRVQPTRFGGVFRIELEPSYDERGYFMRTYCVREFAALGLNAKFVQSSLSQTIRRGTVRGLHFQRPPYEEVKLIQCISGAIYDVVVDLRRGSATYGQWEAFDLAPEKSSSLYVSRGFAHGFQSLTDNTQLLYSISEYYHPESASGIRWNDPRLAIPWPIGQPILSAKDGTLPFLTDLS